MKDGDFKLSIQNFSRTKKFNALWLWLLNKEASCIAYDSFSGKMQTLPGGSLSSGLSEQNLDANFSNRRCR